MKINKLIFLITYLFFLASCSTLETTETQNNKIKSNSDLSLRAESPNHFGWDTANCSHIMADGNCAHPTGANSHNNGNSSRPSTIPNENEINSSNCAHILADGTCAHPL